MSRGQAPRTNHQPSDNAHQGEDNEDDRFSGFLASLEGAEVVLYVHREDLGKRGHLGNLRFDPTQHNIGHLYAIIRKEWGPGSYWIRTQARNGAGFGRGSFRLDIADLTPTLGTAQAAPVSVPAPAVQVPAVPAQPALDVNGLVLGLLRDLVGRLGVPNSASMDPSQLATVVQSAMQAQNSGIQAIAQRLDPNVQGFGVAREILKLARDLGGQVPEQGTGGGGGMDLMMLWMMMQGGNPQQMLPMMMMMQQPQGQNMQQQQQQMMQMMMMMNMMNGGRMPPQMQQMQQQQQQQQPPGWGPFPGPWGPVPTSSTPTRPTPATPTSSPPATPTSSPATPTGSTPATPTSSTPATPTSSPPAANLLHLEGYGDPAALGGLPELLGLSPDQLQAELATMSPEEQQVVMAVQRSLG